jgi:hypothetical protein
MKTQTTFHGNKLMVHRGNGAQRREPRAMRNYSQSLSPKEGTANMYPRGLIIAVDQ